MRGYIGSLEKALPGISPGLFRAFLKPLSLFFIVINHVLKFPDNECVHMPMLLHVEAQLHIRRKKAETRKIPSIRAQGIKILFGQLIDDWSFQLEAISRIHFTGKTCWRRSPSTLALTLMAFYSCVLIRK